MPVIELTTRIIAPQERVFDLARCIQAHEKSAGATRERAIGGFTKGLINLNDEVTWEARHIGIRQKLTVRITKFSRPGYFQDVMISGAFKKMVHDHSFNSEGTTTVMIDRFEFESPLGLLGKIVDSLVLKSYMRRFLVRRNGWLKQLAESNDWESYLKAASKKPIEQLLSCKRCNPASNVQTVFIQLSIAGLIPDDLQPVFR